MRWSLSLLGQGVGALDPAVKRRLVKLIAFDVRIGDEMSPVSVAAQRLARSLARSFETTTPDLALFAPPTRAGWAALMRPLDLFADP